MPISNLIFDGFEPATDLKELISLRMAQILDESPSDSAFNASFSKVGDKYHGLFSVNFGGGIFKAENTQNEPEEVINELYTSLRKQLKEWRKGRFSDDNRGHSFGQRNSITPGKKHSLDRLSPDPRGRGDVIDRLPRQSSSEKSIQPDAIADSRVQRASPSHRIESKNDDVK